MIFPRPIINLSTELMNPHSA